MFRIVLTLFLLLISGVNAQALFSKAKLYTLDNNLRYLTSFYKETVAVCFIDSETGSEIQINGDKLFPLASVAKLPILATAYHQAESGLLNFDQTVKLKQNDIVPGSGLLKSSRPGIEISIRRLLELMIKRSDNTASKMLIDKIGLGYINNYLTRLKLKKTKLVDKTLLNEPPKSHVNLSTATEMAKLCAMLLNEKYFAKDSSEEMIKLMKSQHYRWGIPQAVPRYIEVANKTGNLKNVLNDVGLVYTPSGTYVLAILTYGLEENNAKKLIRNISQMVFKAYI